MCTSEMALGTVVYVFVRIWKKPSVLNKKEWLEISQDFKDVSEISRLVNNFFGISKVMANDSVYSVLLITIWTVIC